MSDDVIADSNPGIGLGLVHGLPVPPYAITYFGVEYFMWHISERSEAVKS